MNMTWIKKIAFHQNVRNETPNKELASELVNENNSKGIKEIAGYLFDQNKSICSDCLAVLYTIGYSKPELIQDYLSDFLKLLESKNNRMVWGSMIALSTIAPLKSDELYEELDLILQTMKRGTLITEVWGIKLLVSLALISKDYKNRLQPLLFDYLKECRPIDFVSRVETILPMIITPEEKMEMDAIIEQKTPELSDSQVKKLKAVLKKHWK
jgi:hypothetical protein